MKDRSEFRAKASPPKSRFDLPPIVKRALEYLLKQRFSNLATQWDITDVNQ
jgi:hypothetical protein